MGEAFEFAGTSYPRRSRLGRRIGRNAWKTTHLTKPAPITGARKALTLTDTPTGTPDLKPHFEDVQAHYDLSDDFFRLFLDPTQTYSCAYFERDDMTLEEAQIAKIDLSLGKLGLEPGMTLLDVGCGWGATIKRAVERHDVNVVGLTLSRNQQAHVQKLLDELPSERSKRVLLQGWEQFNEPVDRIVSIGAFEHFGRDRYDEFFKKAYSALPADGVMMLHTIVKPSDEEFKERGLPITMTKLRFFKFIMDEIFPGGDLPQVNVVENHATKAGFNVALVQPLRLHYARTLDTWAAALEAHKDEAIAIQSQEVYDRYMKYLTGCADLFREGYTDVCQFTLTKS
ncbi:SAM-dependent methyltransferase [Mycolicibacterium agri]|uniref:Cyclopropane-fatty-acyl-phospholipid synthase n=1 Tax=Mycolicibacterium agri TaxID=36811 RepID=A0A2A7MQT8_MYCAG|nr:SAM-dependent methyltransferase [Mycolicibacterium agri]GFG48722.1 cyclopropane-fatty-acyl-phospholipid synthase [Mycolicibacterium agri]